MLIKNLAFLNDIPVIFILEFKRHIYVKHVDILTKLGCILLYDMFVYYAGVGGASIFAIQLSVVSVEVYTLLVMVSCTYLDYLLTGYDHFFQLYDVICFSYPSLIKFYLLFFK